MGLTPIPSFVWFEYSVALKQAESKPVRLKNASSQAVDAVDKVGKLDKVQKLDKAEKLDKAATQF